MKRSILSLLSIMGLSLLWSCVPAFSQTRRASEPRSAVVGRRPVLAIRKLTGIGNRSEVTTPYYQTTVGRGSRPARKWGVVEAVYDSAPEWIDELGVTFYALSLRQEGGRNLYTFYRLEVRYMDVEQGKNHTAAAYLRPSALDRYGEVVAAAVEFSIDGEVVAVENSSKMGDALPPDWWKNDRVLKSDAVTIKDGYLLNREESPFAFVNIDDYEAIK